MLLLTVYLAVGFLICAIAIMCVVASGNDIDLANAVVMFLFWPLVLIGLALGGGSK